MKQESWFAPKLRKALDRSDTSTRSLARAWRPDSPETARRSLIRYLRDGVIPGPAIRAELCDALGIAHGSLDLDADDEEDDQVVRIRRIAHRLSNAGMERLAADLLDVVVELKERERA